jgi:aryl-alcohol dehydrogenase-like predicted oxidoreductase
MHTAELGSLTTSALGFGCMGLSQGYGLADDAESVHTLHRAVDAGITLFDTAMSYGQGDNERLVGRALADRDVHIATKFGIVRTDAGVGLDARPEHVRGYCEASLQRLGRDVIELYYLHRVDPQVPIAATVGAMAELVADGKVRHLGVSEVTPDQLRAACAVHPITAVQVEWSLLWREPETDLVPTARELGVGIVPYSPLGRGLLTATLSADAIDTSDFRRGDPRFHGAELDDNLRQIAALRAFAAERGITAGQLALAWLLAQGDDVVPVPGTRNAARVAENAAAADVRLSGDDLVELERLVPRSGWAGTRQSFAVPVTARRA